MPDLLRVLKKKFAELLCTTVGHNGGVPILRGPLKYSFLPKTSATDNLSMLLGLYEPTVVSELLSAGPVDVAYDVGAHLGFMSLVLSRIVGEKGRVFAFEPIPENRIAIDRLIGMNRLDQVIQVIPFALGESSGKKRMLLRECSSMHQLLEAYQGKGSNIYSTVDVESCTLDSFIFERGNLIPQLIKIDVEGAEELVLKGALRTLEVCKPTMVIEIHGPQNALKTWKLLQGTDYIWRHIARGSRQQITSDGELRSYFSPSSWTHHFLLINERRVSSAPKKSESTGFTGATCEWTKAPLRGISDGSFVTSATGYVHDNPDSESISASQRKDSPPMIGILILNRDGKKWLPLVYASIRAQQYKHFRTYLVDNASTDASIELTRESYPEVSVIRMPQNLGYSTAYNLAMPYAFADGCDWVIWANNDIRLEPGCLSELVRVAVTNPKAGVVGPAFLAWESDEPNYYIEGNYPFVIPAIKTGSPDPFHVDWLEGSFLMVSRRCVEAVGPLDPYYFMYSEEADFCRRARYHGWKILLVPNALARHYAGGSSEGDYEIRRVMNRLQTRNYYIYHLTNLFQSFSRNTVETLHLFGVKTKEHLINQSTASIFFETRALFFTLRNLRTAFLKWQRDRAGGRPPMTTPNLQSLRPEIFRNHSHFAKRDSFTLGRLSANR